MKDEMPKVKLVGEDGNIYNLLGIAKRALVQNGEADRAKEMCDKVMESDSYYKALAIIQEYVDAY